MRDERNVLIVAEASRGSLTSGMRELLALGRLLADALGGSVDLLPFGTSGEDMAVEAAAAGADRICAIEGIGREGYHPDAFAATVHRACAELAPRIVLAGHGPLGLDLAPRVAFGFGARWASSCVGAAIDGGTLRCERHEVGGKVHVVEVIDGRAVITLRPKCVEVPPLRSGRQAVVVHIAPPANQPQANIMFVERHLEDGGASVELEQAAIVVSGGLGLGSSEAFVKLGELAHALGASLAGSKQAVDRGWIAPGRQVGLTGTTVAPRLYVAVALSGALQHMAGCQKARTIVAINTDPSAPIFRFARYGVVAKWEEMVPALLARLPGGPPAREAP